MDKKAILIEKFEKPTRDNGQDFFIWENDYGEIHRRYDLPAFIYRGDKFWIRDGHYHRGGDMPAIVRDSNEAALRRDPNKEDPKYEWIINGRRHRRNNPAVIFENGDKIWYSNGRIHRDKGRPAVITDNYYEWYENGEFIKREYRYHTIFEELLYNNTVSFVVIVILFLGTLELIVPFLGKIISILTIFYLFFSRISFRKLFSFKKE